MIKYWILVDDNKIGELVYDEPMKKYETDMVCSLVQIGMGVKKAYCKRVQTKFDLYAGK